MNGPFGMRLSEMALKRKRGKVMRKTRSAQKTVSTQSSRAKRAHSALQLHLPLRRALTARPEAH
jgi:hypothetical protein